MLKAHSYLLPESVRKALDDAIRKGCAAGGAREARLRPQRHLKLRLVRDEARIHLLGGGSLALGAVVDEAARADRVTARQDRDQAIAQAARKALLANGTRVGRLVRKAAVLYERCSKQ